MGHSSTSPRNLPKCSLPPASFPARTGLRQDDLLRMLRSRTIGRHRRTNMPLVDIQLIEGVFSADQKRQMIEKVTDTLVAIEGEAMRGVTSVRVQESASGAWGIGGQGLTTEDVKALQATRERGPERQVA